MYMFHTFKVLCKSFNYRDYHNYQQYFCPPPQKNHPSIHSNCVYEYIFPQLECQLLPLSLALGIA